jgi:hypothetical protein
MIEKLTNLDGALSLLGVVKVAVLIIMTISFMFLCYFLKKKEQRWAVLHAVNILAMLYFYVTSVNDRPVEMYYNISKHGNSLDFKLKTQKSVGLALEDSASATIKKESQDGYSIVFRGKQYIIPKGAVKEAE